MEYETVLRDQKEIVSRILNSPKINEQRKITGAFKALQDCSERDAEFIDPIVGRLKRFVDRVDIDNPHPDLFNFADGLLSGESDYSNLLCDIIKLYRFMIDSGACWHADILRGISKLILDSTQVCVHESIGNPGYDLMNIRFISDRNSRDELRRKKAQQTINMRTVYLLGKSHWHNSLKDFKCFWRGMNSLADDIEKAETRYKYFCEFGLESMAGEVQNSITDMHYRVLTNQYYGFNQISLYKTATIVAKMCGFTLQSSGKISIAPNFFPGHDLKHADNCVMMCVPLAKFNKSKHIEELVNFLEEFPEASGHALFDNYWVVYPFVDYPENYPFVSDYSNLTQELLDSRCIVAVVLGERDGEYYFISYLI